MGAVPIPMPGGEVYSGLQMGVIDGVEHDAPTVLSSKYYEQAKFGYLTHHVFNPIVAVMNKNILSTMPEEIQKAIARMLLDLRRQYRDGRFIQFMNRDRNTYLLDELVPLIL